MKQRIKRRGSLPRFNKLMSSSLMKTGFWSVNSIILLVLPLFVMTRYLMRAGGMASRLVYFVESLVGWG
ncbi:TRAP transporter large permease subunit [Marinomonas pontica]|uniref:TRAP transporter large permease subunit n=1 Tax=Marinomonas pontica TaxID=264739 RepID=UPI003B98690C